MTNTDPYARKWIIAFAVTLASMMELIDTSIVNVALTQMSANLGATLDEIAWVSTGYIVAAVIVLPMTGWLSGYFGRRRYFTASIIIFTIASALCGQATSLIGLVLARVLQGIGGGALIATSQAILFESFPPQEATMAAAVFGLGMMVGPAIGPTLGGYIVDRFTWPWIFYINIPIGILAAVLVWGNVKDSKHQERASTIDIPGIALIAIGIGSLQFVLERGGYYDWFDSNLIRVLSFCAAAGIILLIWRELTVDEPILDLHVLKDRSLAGGAGFGVVLGVALYGSIFAVPIYTQQLLGWNAETSGWVLFPGAIGSAVAMIFLARLGSKIKDLRWVAAVGAILLCASMVLHSHFTTESGRGDMIWPITLRGFATGCMFIPLATYAVGGLRGKNLAHGSALFNLARQLGGSVGIAVLANLLTHQAAIHRVDLVSDLVAGSPVTDARMSAITHGMIAKGSDSYSATHQALGILNGLVQRQATMMAFRDIFLIVAIVIAVSLPLIMLLRKPATAGMRIGDH
ncbi:MAG TPA: DHA2 family efflux MFS transporter permease subunit [Gemmatimonadaceae bacterium]|jgi:DHA2 family multidrug resistance protein